MLHIAKNPESPITVHPKYIGKVKSVFRYRCQL